VNAFSLLEETRAYAATRLLPSLARSTDSASESLNELLECIGDFLVHGDRHLIRDQLTRLAYTLKLTQAEMAMLLLDVPGAVRSEAERVEAERDEIDDAIRVLAGGINDAIASLGVAPKA
jgi:hypothetical protein